MSTAQPLPVWGEQDKHEARVRKSAAAHHPTAEIGWAAWTARDGTRVRRLIAFVDGRPAFDPYIKKSLQGPHIRWLPVGAEMAAGLERITEQHA